MKSELTGLYAGPIRALGDDCHRSGIYKSPLAQAQVTAEGIAGDQQADRRFHGGPEKALHQFAQDGYAVLTREYPVLEGIAVPGSIGENLSSPELDDASVHIGDIYRIGSVLVQVSQPRIPCWKINQRFGIEGVSGFLERARHTGWYYRVVESGRVALGDSVEHVERVSTVSIRGFHDVVTEHRPAREHLERLIACTGLDPAWRARLVKRRDYLASRAERSAAAGLGKAKL